MIPQSKSLAIFILVVLLGSTQAKTLSLLHVEAEDATTAAATTTESSTTGIFKDVNNSNNGQKPISLIEKTRILRERREVYRRSLQGGFSFTDVPTSSPTVNDSFLTSEPTEHGGKAGPYRTLQPTTSGGKAGPYRTSSPTEAPIVKTLPEPTSMPTESPIIGLEPEPRRNPKKGIALILIGKKGRARPSPTGGNDDSGKGDDGKGDDGKGDDGKGDDGKGDDGKGDDGKGDSDASAAEYDHEGDEQEDDEADDGSRPVSKLLKNWRDNKAGSRRNLRRGGDTLSSSSSVSSLSERER